MRQLLARPCPPFGCLRLQDVDNLVDRPLPFGRPSALRSAPVLHPCLRPQGRRESSTSTYRPSTEGCYRMTQRSSLSGATSRPGSSGELPAPDLVAFIRYCHQRHGASWPELYDEMCAVAARREYHGWDHDQLAARGLTSHCSRCPAWPAGRAPSLPGRQSSVRLTTSEPRPRGATSRRALSPDGTPLMRLVDLRLTAPIRLGGSGLPHVY